MNREIKFRAKSCGVWRYGYYVHFDKKVKSYCYNQDAGDFIVSNRYNGERYYPVIETASIGQYTGLKDKNGKEIYEGDIIRREAYGEFGPNIRVVFFDTESAGFVHQPIRYYAQKIKELLHDDFKSPFNKHITECYTIIGNVYDDKELLSQYVINN